MQSLSESHILIIPLVIPVFTQLLPRATTVVFNIYVDEDVLLVVRDKIGREEEL